MQQLASMMCRDPSVVSRNLTRLGAGNRVIGKVNRKWDLTTQGRQVNRLTKTYLADMKKVLAKGGTGAVGSLSLSPTAALLLVNTQHAMQVPALGKSSNGLATKHLTQLLELWRQRDMPIIHARHLSERKGSLFHVDGPGFEFMTGLEPKKGEVVIDKRHASAFADSTLAKTLDKFGSTQTVIAGFTAHECVDATAKNAISLGFEVFIVSDGIAQFDLTGPSGKVFSAADVHEIVLSGLGQVAKVVQTRELMNLNV